MSVSVENLSVAYRSRRGDVTAVDNVSFSLADGEIMGLAGESGSGKSTLGNALVYLDATDEGRPAARSPWTARNCRSRTTSVMRTEADDRGSSSRRTCHIDHVCPSPAAGR